MHGHLTYDEFLASISGFLCSYYLAIAVMNGFFAAYQWRVKGQQRLAIAWSVVGFICVIMGGIVSSGDAGMIAYVSVPDSIKNMIENDFTSFLEIGPGKVLQGLNRKIKRTIPTKGIQSYDDILTYEI